MQESLLIDIGNSALKFVTYNAADRRFSSSPVRVDWTKIGEFDSVPWSDAVANCDSILISSVNRGHCERLCNKLSALTDVQPRLINYSEVPMQMSVDFPDKVGIDRLLASYAAWGMFGNSKALIVLQVGTAVTIDLVDKYGVFQGGVILPSETTLYTSLAEKADQLPKVEVDASRFEIDLVAPGELLHAAGRLPIDAGIDPPGKNTIDAIKIGVSHCMRGGVEWTYQRYCRLLGTTLPVVATGGGAVQLRIDDMPMTIVSNLVLKGLAILCDGKR